jgi:hypothetical protein
MVRHRRNFAHVDAAENDDATFADSFQCLGYEVADGSEDDRRIHGGARVLVGAARPHAAETASERLGLGIAGARKCIDRPLLELRDLSHNVRCRAKSIDAEGLGIARHAQCAMADQPRAQQRRSRRVRVVWR